MSSKPATYAKGTYVGIGRSKDEIDAELRRMGATRRAVVDDDENCRAVVMFEREGIRYRLILPLPDSADRSYRFTPARGFLRSDAQAREAYEQDARERWRALGAYIKALRVAWEAGIIKIEEAILPYAVLPHGGTVSEYILPQLPESYAHGRMPPLLPGVDDRMVLALPSPTAESEASE